MNLPKMAWVRQVFQGPTVTDIEGEVFRQLDSLQLEIAQGSRIAITAGSRGIANIPLVLRSAVRWLRKHEADPFIVPAMGSHGGATAAGQVAVLKGLGVTEDYVEAPIISSMEVVEISRTANGQPVWMDKQAYQADGVLLIGRVKPHTDFRSTTGIESGLTKMASIGLGKHKQALAIHSLGINGLQDTLPAVGRSVLNSGKILAGLAIVENAWEQTAIIEGVHPEDIMQRDATLLAEARNMMPKLPANEIDILLVDQMGKDFSGTGLDTNIIGRLRIRDEEEFPSPEIGYVIVSDLSDGSKGNALGVGLADFTTKRLFDKIDLQMMNENVITSTFVARGAIPLVLPGVRQALDAAMRCSWGLDPEKAKIMRIPNTLHLERIQVSETLLPLVLAEDHVELISGPQPLVFDEQGYLVSEA